MNIKITGGHLTGKVQIISSKSDGHRLLIAAALADTPTQIHIQGVSEDIETTVLCLKNLGAKFERKDDIVFVTPVPPYQENIAVLDCRESGSTLRFILPVAAALGRSILVEGAGRLPKRPIGILTELLSHHGCYISSNQLPLEMSGQLTAGTFTLPGNVSSQFITGLLFALPLLDGDSEIKLTTPLESKGYVDMTLHTLKRFGIQIIKTESGFQIPGKQKYHSPGTLRAEGDWSNAAFWLAAGAASGNGITCCGLQQDSPQGDKAIVPLLKQFGAKIEIQDESVTVQHAALKGCRIDVSQIPDLMPILCIVASMAKGKTEIYNAGRLRIKESDRLSAMADCLHRLGIRAEESQDGMTIYGREGGIPDEIQIDAYNDHRIVMSAAVGAIVLGLEITIIGAEAVAKSYPAFFAEFIRLGGGADVL